MLRISLLIANVGTTLTNDWLNPPAIHVNDGAANELMHNKDRENSPDLPDSQKLCNNLCDYFVNNLLTIRQIIRDQLTLYQP